MQFTCESEKLRNSITVVEKAVSQKSSLPVLENIFLELKGTALKLRGNNLEIGIENGIVVENPENEGSVLIKAKTLSGIFSRIDDDRVHIHVDESQKFSIRGDKVDFDILGSNSEDYPVFPSIKEGMTFSIAARDLKELLKHTVIAISYDETKQFLNGILVKVEEENLVFVSTDGYRLALKKHAILPLEKMVSAIIPSKAVNELNRLLQGEPVDSMVEVTLSENQVAFKLNTCLLISRLIQGQFPDYNQVIPSQSLNQFKVNRQAFLAAAERSAIIAMASNNVVRFSFDEDKMSLFAVANGLGDFKEELSIERLSGKEDVKIAFNIRLLLDLIKTVSSENLILSFNNELSPCKITIENDDSFVYIIMPIRTTDYKS